MRQIILDTETTGLETAEGHRIIEIGCIELVNRKFTGKRFHQYINPERAIDKGALDVHGITPEFLQSKPVFSAIANDFIEFVQGAELIIHNAPFDMGFLKYEFSLAGLNWKATLEKCRVIDTLVLARQIHVGQRNGLDALCKRYQVDNSQRDFHGALLDAHLLAQVYLAMTGGQGNLFDDIQSTESAMESKANTVVLNSRKRNLFVLKASESEEAEHAARLAKMSEKGKCLWK